jgi:hypothetical protein
MSAKSRGNFPHYPNPDQCCERCVFGTGNHSTWCPQMRWMKEQPKKITHSLGCGYWFGLSCNCYVPPERGK